MKRKFNLSLFAIPALIFVGFFSATQQVYETTPSQTTMISEEVSQIDDPSFVSTNVERVSRTSAIIYFELNEGGHSGDIHSEDILFILDQSDQTTPMLIDYNNGFGRIAVTNLVPDTFYNFTIEVFFGNAELISSEGSFTTATRDEPSLSNIEIDMWKHQAHIDFTVDRNDWTVDAVEVTLNEETKEASTPNLRDYNVSFEEDLEQNTEYDLLIVAKSEALGDVVMFDDIVSTSDFEEINIVDISVANHSSNGQATLNVTVTGDIPTYESIVIEQRYFVDELLDDEWVTLTIEDSTLELIEQGATETWLISISVSDWNKHNDMYKVSMPDTEIESYEFHSPIYRSTRFGIARWYISIVLLITAATMMYFMYSLYSKYRNYKTSKSLLTTNKPLKVKKDKVKKKSKKQKQESTFFIKYGLKLSTLTGLYEIRIVTNVWEDSNSLYKEKQYAVKKMKKKNSAILERRKAKVDKFELI